MLSEDTQISRRDILKLSTVGTALSLLTSNALSGEAFGQDEAQANNTKQQREKIDAEAIKAAIGDVQSELDYDARVNATIKLFDLEGKIGFQATRKSETHYLIEPVVKVGDKNVPLAEHIESLCQKDVTKEWNWNCGTAWITGSHGFIQLPNRDGDVYGGEPSGKTYDFGKVARSPMALKIAIKDFEAVENGVLAAEIDIRTAENLALTIKFDRINATQLDPTQDPFDHDARGF